MRSERRRSIGLLLLLRCSSALGALLTQPARAEGPPAAMVDRWTGQARRRFRRGRAELLEPLHEAPLPEIPNIEHFEGRPQADRSEGSSTERPHRRRLRQVQGAAMLEWLIAVPVLLFCALVLLQFSLIVQARQALRLGVMEAAREASVAHADPQAALRGLARGLAPWLHGARDAQDALIGPIQTQVLLSLAVQSGQLKITQLSPTASSFQDWAQPARDALGRPMDGVLEIPNDALRFRSTDAQPAGGAGPSLRGEPTGLRSGQTLMQANLLRLQVDYALPLVVPLVGPIWARLAGHWASEPRPVVSRARNVSLPLRVFAAVQMQSPARHAGASQQ
jgi:hypothetical protein